MKAPDKIYIQPDAHDGWFEGNKPNDRFVEYIRKDALLESLKKELEIMERIKRPSHIGAMVLQRVIDKINSL